ncbi:hypothetical protein FUAX_12400 [Fulvitalea axinellae]|uniref:Lipocalin-like domain-containing protein n=1 Tax=Fulvitalea axinellae TaxID=1182444 RepID=A0AAU9CL91_9BACT|nr:hypothetical protein FUAX_12400 [Fulvitalea axinellae]
MRRLLIPALFLSVFALFSSCSDNDDDDSTPAVTASQLHGTWAFEDVSSELILDNPSVMNALPGIDAEAVSETSSKAMATLVKGMRLSLDSKYMNGNFDGRRLTWKYEDGKLKMRHTEAFHTKDDTDHDHQGMKDTRHGHVSMKGLLEGGEFDLVVDSVGQDEMKLSLVHRMAVGPVTGQTSVKTRVIRVDEGPTITRDPDVALTKEALAGFWKVHDIAVQMPDQQMGLSDSDYALLKAAVEANMRSVYKGSHMNLLTNGKGVYASLPMTEWTMEQEGENHEVVIQFMTLPANSALPSKALSGKKVAARLKAFERSHMEMLITTPVVMNFSGQEMSFDVVNTISMSR